MDAEMKSLFEKETYTLRNALESSQRELRKKRGVLDSYKNRIVDLEEQLNSWKNGYHYQNQLT